MPLARSCKAISQLLEERARARVRASAGDAAGDDEGDDEGVGGGGASPRASSAAGGETRGKLDANLATRAKAHARRSCAAAGLGNEKALAALPAEQKRVRLSTRSSTSIPNPARMPAPPSKEWMERVTIAPSASEGGGATTSRRSQGDPKGKRGSHARKSEGPGPSPVTLIDAVGEDQTREDHRNRVRI